MSLQAIIWHGKYQGKEPAMPKLTQIGLRSLIKKPGRYSDGQGLFFRVLDANKAYFVYRYRVGGKERETSLGAFPELGLAEARERHAELRKQVKVDKIDPIAQKRAAKTVQPSVAPTFGQMADEFIRTHEATWRNDKHVWQWRQTLTTHAAAIRDRPVDEVDTEAVLRVLTPLWSAVPETAARLRGRIEAVLASAQVDGWIPEDRPNAARWKNWLDRKLPKRKRLTRGHHAAMPYVEVPEFVKRLRATQGGSMAALALEFLILTATRTGETIDAIWREIDLEARTWLIPPPRMKKTDEAFSVPLSDRAVAILAEARRVAPKPPGPDSFVFFGVIPKRPLSNMALSMLLRRMKVDVTVHGFRTSFRTWASEVGHVEFEIAESCLSHRVGNAVSRAYNRSNLLDRRRPVMASWAAYVEGKSDAKVIAINGGRNRR
jgi:integrase